MTGPAESVADIGRACVGGLSILAAPGTGWPGWTIGAGGCLDDGKCSRPDILLAGWSSGRTAAAKGEAPSCRLWIRGYDDKERWSEENR
jgi:hypothetical protein